MPYVLSDKVLPEFATWADELAAIRHEVHKTPELGFDTERTVSRILKLLGEWGVENPDSTTVPGGVIAVIEGERPGATIAFRADIDALPMDDKSGKPWASLIPGHAHACGHDGHQTWLLGTVRYLSLHRDFPGRVVAIFQPAEENVKGADAMIASGIFEKYGIREIYGAHDEPNLPKDVFGFHPGPLQASSANFWITVKGAGTHGGRPHLGTDPIPAGALLVSALQTIVSRKVDPIEPAVLSICSINAGRFEAPNVIPGELTLSGTIRTYSDEVQKQIITLLREMCADVAKSEGCTVDVKIENGAKSVLNDPERTKKAAAVAANLFGPEHVADLKPFMSSEDFGSYQRIVPGVMMRVGIRDESHVSGVHSPNFDFNDEVLPAACTLFATIIRTRLEELAG